MWCNNDNNERFFSQWLKARTASSSSEIKRLAKVTTAGVSIIKVDHCVVTICCTSFSGCDCCTVNLEIDEPRVKEEVVELPEHLE